ncbi:ABC transporter family substrate-binding protein [Spelaeicoccus albus]|uniref:Peptide/nickel transport system substrate-binding protein n=1 Tax=Spelaeicoccus albus TaxID=1280376 RepID=A0A7Z0ACX5_9MICO|nr:ABC transporter family substrate-binding protein [Spelaeicoccus albus]NYI67056.1 peptide/nickel transport system substrate-binding protein [Spelaeicoccus albus]
MNHQKTGRAVAVVAALGLMLSGCQGGTNKAAESDGNRVTGKNLNTINSAAVKSGTGEVTMAIGKTIPNWNTLTIAGDVSETVWVTSALYPSVFNTEPDAKTIKLNKDLIKSAKVIKQDPTTIRYQIQKDAVWSDGVPINADDFIYQWKVLNKKDCPNCQIRDAGGFDKVAKIESTDNKKTVTVTMKENYSEWQQLFQRLLPAHIAKKAGSLAQSFNEYFVKNTPKFSGGPFIISDAVKNQSVTLTPNPKWYGKKPNLKKVTFRMITDAQQVPTALRNDEVQVIYPQPQVDLLQSVKEMQGQGIKYQMNKSLVFETFTLNLSNSLLKNRVVRRALYTALDTKQMVAKTAGQLDPSLKPLQSLMILANQDGYEPKAGKLGFGEGAVKRATSMLKDAGYKIVDGKLMEPNGSKAPALRLVYTAGNPTRQAECEILAAVGKKLGLKLNIETTDSLGDTIAENGKYGYDIVVAGYTGAPFYASNASKRWTTGTGYNEHYSNSKVDKLVNQALQAKSRDEAIKLINEADQQVMSDVYMIPLYQMPSLIAYAGKYGNIRDNPSITGPTYNIQDWGIRKDQ